MTKFRPGSVFRRAAAMLLLSGLVAACATLKTGVDYDQAVDFSDYRTASWEHDSVVVAPGTEPVSALTKRRVREAIESNLASHGIVMTDDDAADLHVGAVVGSRQKITRESYPVHPIHPYDRWRWCGAWCYDVRYVERTYAQGTLSVDLFDAKTDQPIWHGWVQKTITSADRDDPKRSIEEGVAAMFEGFPAGR